MHPSMHSSSSSQPVAWLVQVFLLCLVAFPCLLVRGDVWSYTASFTLSGGGALEGAPTITSNPTPNYAQNISLPAAAANQGVIITFFNLPLTSELSTGGTSAIFTAPAAGATALVATFRFSESVDQMGASTDFPLTITVLAPSTARNWDASVDAPGSPATFASAGLQAHTVTFPFNITKDSRAKVTFVLAAYATLAEGAGNNNAGSPALSLVGGNPVLQITLPAPSQTVTYAFITTSQSGATSSWSISFVVEDYPLNWFNNGWTATVSGLLIGPSSLDSSVVGNGTFVWAESEANTPQTFHITIVEGATISPPFAGKDVPFTLGPAGTSGVVTFRIQSPGGVWASWVFTVRVNKDSANTGTDGGGTGGGGSSSSSSSSSTGGGGGTKPPVDPPPDQNTFDGAAASTRGTGSGSSMMLLLPAILSALLLVVFGQMAQPAQGTL